MLCEADQRHALIIAYSHGNPSLPEVHDDAKVVENFANKHNFKITPLLDQEATSDAIIEFFALQAVEVLKHAKQNTSKKYLILVFYAGHGSLVHGTQRVSLHN